MMGFIIYMLGGVLGVTGLVMFLLDYRLCRLIVNATASDSEGLKHAEIWTRQHQFKKWKKLKRFRQSGDVKLRKMASKAILFEIMYCTFWGMGLVLLFIGASI